MGELDLGSQVIGGIQSPLFKLFNSDGSFTDVQLTDTQEIQWKFIPDVVTHELVNEGEIKLKHNGWRMEVTFIYDKLGIADAQKLVRIVTHQMGTDNRVRMLPHREFMPGVEEWDVVYAGNFDLLYFRRKYVGHAGKFTFRTKKLIRAIPWQTTNKLMKKITWG